MFHFLSEDEIHLVYKTHVVKPRSYLNRIQEAEDFEAYPFFSSVNLKRIDAGRPFCVLDFYTWLAKYSITPRDILVTSKTDPEVPLLPTDATFTEIRYEDGYDLHTLSLDKRDFDFCLISHTLEHLYNPEKAMRNIYDHLRPGGYFFTSVPTTNIPHDTPIHFQQFLPTGLATLGIQAGFQIKEVGFWGNQEYLVKLFQTNAWPTVYELANLTADPNHPAGCWALFQKPPLSP
jgi:SAM-dependent methyltransferase